SNAVDNNGNPTTWDGIQEKFPDYALRKSLDTGEGKCSFSGATQVVKFGGSPISIMSFTSTTYSPSGGGSEPTFTVGNGEIETRDSTTCDMSSGVHDCDATETLRGVEEYFLVSYGVDGATQLKYFNQPSWSFNPGPGSNPSQKMAVLISEKEGDCPFLGFDEQINQISGWPGRWGIGYNQGNDSWADILRSETANGIARGDMYVCRGIYSTVSGANFFVQHRGEKDAFKVKLTMSAYSISRSGSPVVEINYPDLDNDGIPNDSDPDVDGDGIPNTSDKDIDGDGIENKNDRDIDGDGKTNGIDPDADGDGTPDAEDDTPGGPQ
ncbi:MAG: hypothetical protein L7U43_03310, partial [Arenicellales bacterium]|nr:hypothetical protein [Arenicellales bacterium]